MYQPSKSTPRMRKAYTPRVKGGHDPQIHNNVSNKGFFSDKKPQPQFQHQVVGQSIQPQYNRHENVNNPETIEYQIQKKLAHNDAHPQLQNKAQKQKRIYTQQIEVFRNQNKKENPFIAVQTPNYNANAIKKDTLLAGKKDQQKQNMKQKPKPRPQSGNTYGRKVQWDYNHNNHNFQQPKAQKAYQAQGNKTQRYQTQQSQQQQSYQKPQYLQGNFVEGLMTETPQVTPKPTQKNHKQRCRSAVPSSSSCSTSRQPIAVSNNSSSFAYPNFTQKTDRIKQHKKIFDQKFQVAFDYLIRSNSAYLGQHSRVCNQKARPLQERVQIERPVINTTKKDDYQKYSNKYAQPIQAQNTKSSLLMSTNSVCAKSSRTQQTHTGRQGPKAQLATWGVGYKLQGPMGNIITTAQNAYPNHGNFDKMIPVATFNQHPLGMSHRQISTHRRFFKGEHVPRAQLATWNNLNPYANDFSPDRQTAYKSAHGGWATGSDKNNQKGSKSQSGWVSTPKQQHLTTTQKWPNSAHKLLQVDGKFSTEYRDTLKNFNKHQLNVQNHCSCDRRRH